MLYKNGWDFDFIVLLYELGLNDKVDVIADDIYSLSCV